MTLATYTSTRQRGFCEWRPQSKTRVLLEQVRAVLAEYATHLPVTARQVFYRLVGAYDYPKDERAYERLLNLLGRARRASIIPFDALRDDGVTTHEPGGFYDMLDFLQAVRHAAQRYRRRLRVGQPHALEIWCEAAGMAPQLARVAHEFGVTVYSSSGFDSLTVKHEAAQRIVQRREPTIILHVGDHDPSGVAIFDSAAADVAALARGFDEPFGGVEFRRVAVTPEQVARFGLPEAPAKRTDRRGNWQGGTVQAESLAPDELASELRAALDELTDAAVLEQQRALGDGERDALVERVEEWIAETGELSG